MKQLYIFLLALFFYHPIEAQYYLGTGVNYNALAGESADRNKNSLGYHVEFENRSVCWLWFGVHADYINLEPLDDYPLSQPYYESILSISPTIRYNYLSLDCNSYDLVPYLKSQINLGLANNSDELSRMGMGTTFGTGIAYSINLWDQCWMIDMGIDWISPNNIILADGRLPIFYYQADIALSWRIQ